MLVDADLCLTKKNRKKDSVPEEYKNVDIDALMELKMEVDNYHALLSNIFGDEEYESELEEELFEDEIENL